MEDIELLKKQYEAVKKQRDDIKYFLVDLIDTISSAAYNNFNLKEDVVDENGNKVCMFDGINTYAKALGDAHYFHIARLLDKLKEYDVSIENQPHKAELAILLEKWKLPEEIEQWKGYYKINDPEKMTEAEKLNAIKALATHLVVFSYEYNFSKDYPSADRGVYSDAFVEMVRLAMHIAGIPSTSEGVEKTLKEAYSANKEASLKKV